MVQLVAGGGRKADVTGVHVKYRSVPGAAAEIMKDEKEYQPKMSLRNPEIMDAERTPFLGALFRYTADLNARNREFERGALHRDHAPVMSLAAHIKACSLFPNIYEKADKEHRTFPKVKVEGADDSQTGMMKKRKGGEAYQAGSAAF